MRLEGSEANFPLASPLVQAEQKRWSVSLAPPVGSTRRDQHPGSWEAVGTRLDPNFWVGCGPAEQARGLSPAFVHAPSFAITSSP